MASVLIAVFDGLQPAQVIPELMPNLASLAARVSPSLTIIPFIPRSLGSMSPAWSPDDIQGDTGWRGIA